MKKLLLTLMLVFTALFTFDSLGFDAFAQDIVQEEVVVDRAADLPTEVTDIPAWVIQVFAFAESVPVIGPYIGKVLVFAGIAAALLTVLSTLLMGLSGILMKLQDREKSPKWLRDAKKYVDMARDIAMELSVFNRQKKK